MSRIELFSRSERSKLLVNAAGRVVPISIGSMGEKFELSGAAKVVFVVFVVAVIFGVFLCAAAAGQFAPSSSYIVRTYIHS